MLVLINLIRLRATPCDIQRSVAERPPRPAADADGLLRCFVSAKLCLQELIAGGIAGGIAKTTISPLERCKILFQVSAIQPPIAGVQLPRWGVPAPYSLILPALTGTWPRTCHHTDWQTAWSCTGPDPDSHLCN